MTSFHTDALEELALATVGGRASKSVNGGDAIPKSTLKWYLWCFVTLVLFTQFWRHKSAVNLVNWADVWARSVYSCMMMNVSRDKVWERQGVGGTRWPRASSGSVTVAENRAPLTSQPRWPHGLLAPRGSALLLLSLSPAPPLRIPTSSIVILSWANPGRKILLKGLFLSCICSLDCSLEGFCSSLQGTTQLGGKWDLPFRCQGWTKLL